MKKKVLFYYFIFLLMGYSEGQQLQIDWHEHLSFLPGESGGEKGPLNDPSLPWRLPQNIVPIKYDLSIIPILENDTSNSPGSQWSIPGEVDIHFIVGSNATDQIVLHQNGIDIEETETTITKEDNTTVAILHSNYSVGNMFYTLYLAEQLSPNTTYTVHLKFTSKVQEDFHGMYRSSYVIPETGERKWMILTQMEALHARELFPSFDEPSFKAIFNVRIGRKESHISLCNGGSLRNDTMEGYDGWLWETFEETVPMSTYLFAAVVSEYTFAEAAKDILPETVVRVYGPDHYISRGGGDYSADITARLLKDFEEKFLQKYPLSKMDFASVNDDDFFFGAMENYGLNIYQERLVMYLKDENTEAERGSVARVVAHELAHQNFGNLVSPAWWTHIWLNEGMATFVQFHGLESVAPEYTPRDLFIYQSFQTALAYDARADVTHPLKINETEWIEKYAMDWFSPIAYNKGASIATMMEGFLKPGPFNRGLQIYLETMKYLSAEQDNLFEALNSQAGEDTLPNGTTLKEVMESWTMYPGFPLVTARININNNRIELTQNKYGDSASANLWTIPVSIATAANPDFDPTPEYWMTARNLGLNETGESWAIINAGTTGFYRVLYEDTMLENILNQLDSNHSIIHSHTRSQLIDDYLNFVWNNIGEVQMENALSLTLYMNQHAETDITVWTPLFKGLETYLRLFGSAGILSDMKSYLLPRILKTLEAKGGYDSINIDTQGIDAIAHSQLLDWACALGDQGCIDYAASSVAEWEAGVANNRIPRDLRPVVYCASTKKSNDHHDFLTALYRNETNGLSVKQRNIILNSLPCSTDATLVQSLLDGIFQEELFLSKSHASLFLQRLSSNHEVRDLLVTYLQTRVRDLLVFFDGNKAPLEALVGSLSGYMSTQGELDKMKEFATANQDIFQGSLDRHLATIQVNIDLITRHGLPMQAFFQAHKDDSTDTTTNRNVDGGAGGVTWNGSLYLAISLLCLGNYNFAIRT